MVAFFASCNLFAIESNPTDPVKKENSSRANTIFVENNDKVYLNLDNPELNTIKVEVRDALDRLVYQEVFKDKEAVKKTLNFTKAYSGSYYITVCNGTNTFSKSIKI